MSRRFLRASLYLYLALTVLLPCAALATDTATAGGVGQATDFTRGCDVGKLLIGLKVQRHLTGGWIERIQGICSAYDANGVRIGERQLSAVAGGSGTTSLTSLCPGNKAIKSIRGRYSQYVDRVQPVCADVVGGAAGGTEVNADALGNGPTSGAASFNLACPNAELARALRGKANWYVDRIGLRCSEIEVAATNADVHLPLEATAGQQETGLVVLNGYARAETIVLLEPTWAGGSLLNSALEMPSHVVIPAGADQAPFTFRPTISSAGCLTVRANAPTLMNSQLSEFMFVSSAPNTSLSSPYALGTDVSVRDHSTLTVTWRGPAGTSAALTSSAPSSLVAPARTPVIPKGASSVSFSVSSHVPGCAVLSAQTATAVLRRAILVYLGN